MKCTKCTGTGWYPAAIVLGFVVLGVALFLLFRGVIQQRVNHRPMPYVERIDGCRYILTPDRRGQIVHTEHAANCDNKEHGK
jgi:hypothetical protein